MIQQITETDLFKNKHKKGGDLGFLCLKEGRKQKKQKQKKKM